jgi:hypothetical protein
MCKPSKERGRGAECRHTSAQVSTASKLVPLNCLADSSQHVVCGAWQGCSQHALPKCGVVCPTPGGLPPERLEWCQGGWWARLWPPLDPV